MHLRYYVSYAIACNMLFVFTRCGEDGELSEIEQVQSATSQLCQNVTGAEAIFWDMSNGVIRTDLPGGVPPTVDIIGGNYIHNAYPPLSFIYPAGWAPETINVPNTVGVNLIRQDRRAAWTWLGAAANGVPNARQVRDAYVNELIQFLQATGNVETVCVSESSRSPAPGIVLSFSTIMVRAGEFTAVVGAQVSALEGLPQSQVGVQVSAGPTAEFSQLIFDVYLAIGFQLLYGRDTIVDSDGDGTPDTQDNFPHDPTRQ